MAHLKFIRFILIVLLLFQSSLLASRKAFAQESSVLLTVDKAVVSMGEDLVAQITLKGPQQTGQLKLHNVGAFAVSTAEKSSRVNIVNGITNSETIFSFQVLPKKQGKFLIGPATLTVNGVSFQSNQVEIVVNIQKEAVNAPNAKERSFYITVDVNNRRPYVGEQIVYTFLLFNRGEITHAEMTLPDFSGFLKEEIGKQKSYDKVMDGVKWNVAEIKYAIFPLMGGEMTIPPARVTADVVVRNAPNSRFPSLFVNRTEKVTVSSEPISLLVSRTPTAGKPEDFVGLVGSVTVTASASKQTIEKDRSTTLTLTIEGNANIRDFQWVMPKLSEFTVYDDKPSFDLQATANQVIGKKIFKKSLLPLKSGEIEIPKITIAYFDPDKKLYRFAETKPIRLNVAEVGTGKTDLVMGQTAEKNGVEVFGRDLLPIKRTLGAHSDNISPGKKRGILITLFTCLILYAIIFVLKRRRDALSSDTAYMRREKAYKRFQDEAKKICSDDAFFPQASYAIRTYLGNRFNLVGGALTSADTDSKLRPFGIAEEVIQKIKIFLQVCELAQYGGGTNENRDALAKDLTELVLEIENNPLTPFSKGESPTKTMATILLFVFFLIPNLSWASTENTKRFLIANAAYEQGDYKKAIETYSLMLSQERANGEIHFNLGNSFFRSNQLGQAIFHFRKALQFIPRDPDIRYNLAFAREKVSDQIEEGSSFSTRLFAFTEFFTMREHYFIVLFLALISFSVSLANLYLKRGVAPLAPATKWTQNIMVAILILSLLTLFVRERTVLAFGVVAAHQISVYSGFERDSVVIFRLHEGVEFDRTDSAGKDWTQITLADGNKGWVRNTEILF